MSLISTRGCPVDRGSHVTGSPSSGRWCRWQLRSPGRPRETTSCSGAPTPMRTMPDWSDCMTRAPRIAPGMVPIPPESDVPPMTAAAIT